MCGRRLLQVLLIRGERFVRLVFFGTRKQANAKRLALGRWGKRADAGRAERRRCADSKSGACRTLQEVSPIELHCSRFLWSQDVVGRDHGARYGRAAILASSSSPVMTSF